MKSYLNALNEREKWMVLGAGLLLIFYAYYLLLYAPLSHRVMQKSAQLVDKIQTLEWMKKIKQQGLPERTKQTVDNNQLLTILANKLKNETSLKFTYQLQQTSSGDIQLTFDEVPFNPFILWIEKINQHYTIKVKQFEADRTKTSGVTRLMILISSAS